MGNFAEGAPSAGDNTAPNWQRGATRRAIIDAARLVAARTESTDFSLNTVAKEAGYSTTTIFAYFATKNDLFNAIVADDLAGLARRMRDGYAFAATMPEPEAEPEPETPLAEPAPQIFDVVEPQATTVVAFTPSSEAKPDSPSDDAAKPPPRADAWLERRLRVFEKSLADIETRLATSQRDSSKAVSAAEDITKVFGARLDASEKRVAELSGDVTTRLSAAEKRLRETHTDLRNSLLNASMRIDMLEAAAQRIAAGVGYTPPAEPEAQAAEPVAEPEISPDNPLADTANTYLSAARRAAQTAATLAALEQDTKKKKTASRSRFNRKYAIIAAATALAFVLGATVSYAVGDHVGRTTPIRIFAPPAQTHAVKTADGQFDRLTALALAGNSKAELLVGLRYLKGLGAPIDEPRAAKWIVRASVSQDPLAQYWMGEIYEHGEGVSADAAEALRWYLAAAGQGNREAMYDVGIAYAEGLGAQKNLTQSAHWFEKAAMLGLTNAQFNLAVLYERGEGVPQSLRDAYVWYAVAAANGDTESRARVDAIATQLNAPSLAAAKSAAATFHAAPLDRAANVMPNMGVRPGA